MPPELISMVLSFLVGTGICSPLQIPGAPMSGLYCTIHMTERAPSNVLPESKPEPLPGGREDLRGTEDKGGTPA